MRVDATIDKRQVLCKNASHLGFDKVMAQVGDILTWTDGHTGHTVGRMIGRVHYAPALEGDKGPVRDYILVIGLNSMLDHTFERWVNPTDVTRVQTLLDQQAVMAYFLSDEMTSAPIDEVRRSTTDGWSTLGRYRAWKDELAANQADYDTRHPKVDREQDYA